MKILLKFTLVIHRYLGFVLSILFLVWFVSGFVMMYKDFPNLAQSEKQKRSTALTVRDSLWQPVQISQLYRLPDTLQALKISSLLHWPVYRFQSLDGKWQSFYASNGKPVQNLSAYHASVIARFFSGNGASIKKIETIDHLDQWTPRTRYVAHLPIHRVWMNDTEETVCYVSSASGEIVQFLNREDKFWAWLGAIPHWIYFRDLRIHNQLWRDVVVGLSIFGVMMSVAGIALGIVRTIRAKRDRDRFSPYKKKWFRWHHYVGFFFGVFVFTWILSGLFSMNPWRWSPDSSLSAAEKKLWQGGHISTQNIKGTVEEVIKKFSTAGELKEMQLVQVYSAPYWLGYYSDNTTKLLSAGDLQTDLLDSLPKQKFLSLLTKLQPSAQLTEATWLMDYDAYYYNKHRTRPLPVLRAKFNDAAETWYYVNVRTGLVVEKIQARNRLERWLYNGLHSLDFPVFFYQRPLWDVVVILLMTGGTALSVTGLVLTAKWMKRKTKKAIRHV
ncbi:MAG: PepSY domain-containing protein [Flammeovirgaceae bacterium]